MDYGVSSPVHQIKSPSSLSYKKQTWKTSLYLKIPSIYLSMDKYFMSSFWFTLNFSVNPCKKYDADSHENSISFLVTTRLGGSLVQIHTEFHDYSMSFIQVSFVFYDKTWHGTLKSSSHGISMASAKKMMGFPSDLVSLSTNLSSKRHEKIPVAFFTRSWFEFIRTFSA